MKTVFAFPIISVLLLIQIGTSGQSLRERLRSTEAQVRCDAFYELFHPGEDKEPPLEIYGKSTKEIHELLGDPTATLVLEYRGVKWLMVQYLFEKCPTIASPAQKKSCDEGWRFGPAVFFRNNISVPYQVYSDETESCAIQ